MSAANDSEDERERPEETFGPVFRLVLPDKDCLNFEHNVAAILHFLESRSITKVDQIGIFDTQHLREDAVLDASFHVDEAVERLSTVCQYIAVFGGESFLKIDEELWKKPLWSCPHCEDFHQFEDHNGRRDLHVRRCKEESMKPTSSAHTKEEKHANAILKKLKDLSQYTQQDIPDDMDLSKLTVKDRSRFSLGQARKRFHPLFNRDIYTCAQIMEGGAACRKEWLSLGVLNLIDLYPSLAWEKVRSEGVPASVPFFFFLFAGYEMEVLQQVLAHNPSVLSKANREEGGKFPIDAYLKELAWTTPRYCDIVEVEVFQRIQELIPDWGRGRDEEYFDLLFLERLFGTGYRAEVLEQVRTVLDGTVTEFCLKRSPELRPYPNTYEWTMDVPKADVVLKIVPQLQRLECDGSSWTADGFAHLLDSLASIPLPKLESLTLSMPAGTIHSSIDAHSALWKFFEVVNGDSLKKVALKNVTSRSLDASSCFEQYTSCLRDITNGLASNKTESVLPHLALKGLDLCAPGSAALFQHDIFLNLNVQFDTSLRYRCPWESKNTKVEGVKVSTLSLDGWSSLSQPGDEALWRQVSQLSRLEKVMYSPGHARWGNDQWIIHPLSMISRMQNLTTLCLFSHANTQATIQITEHLVNLLGHGSLEFLQVEGSYEDHRGDIGCLAYSIVLSELCEALRVNKSLQFLFLRGNEIEGSNISKSFLDVLLEHNTTIEFMDICDDQHFYTIIPKDSWRRDVHHGFTYEHYPAAWQIYYLTCFNRFGRRKVRDKSTTTEDFVDLLLAAHSRVDIGAEEELFHETIIQMATSKEWDWPASHFSAIYDKLILSPESWCNAVKRHIEALSIKYALLRESPGLWCSSVLHQDASRKRKRLVSDCGASKRH